ncbi:hypothetical protein GGR50DRAFT_164226 [Xylaria sp. CBS 124048]|nr:hypothetical protein GGR50DRAFT_164226 [Xylaria sp. CBS 124048]
MASLPSLPDFGLRGAKYRNPKLRGKSAARPSLKIWPQSEKEKPSLDLDRAWDEKDRQYGSTQCWGTSLSPSFRNQSTIAGPEPASTFAPGGGGAPGTSGEAGPGMLGDTPSVQPYGHSRSTSATSHGSVAISMNSSNAMPTTRQAGGSFVHPFQQTPRTSTPPLLSYANSSASIGNIRDYSPPTITEDEDDDTVINSTNPTIAQPYSPNGSGSGSGSHGGSRCSHNNISDGQNHNNHTSRGDYIHHTNPIVKDSNSHSHPALTVQEPTLAAQCASSSNHTSKVHSSHPAPPLPPPQLPPQILPPILPRTKPLRTSPTIPARPSRLVNVSSGSDQYLNRTVNYSPSCISTITTLPSPTYPVSPMSPLRHSLDGAVPRLRAKSELDVLTRTEYVREARRRFEERERVKDEKFAREEVKRRERAESKRAQELEKKLAAQHKEELAARAREESAELEEACQRGKQNRKVSVTSSGRPSLSIPRPSLSLGRPSMSRKNTYGPTGDAEKFMSSSYDNVAPRHPPAYGTEARPAPSTPKPPKRKNTAKKKTQNAWTSFILWLRTKLFRLSRH